MFRPTLAVLASLLASAMVISTGCSPAQNIINRTASLPEDIQPVIRDAIWAHGSPYVWAEKKNLVMETRWSDYRHGFKPIENRKVYCIDLASRRMRIDDLTTQTTAMYDGIQWRVFFRGREMKKPSQITSQTVGYLFMFEHAAGEMRIIRSFFRMPYSLLDDGVKLKGLGQVRTPSGGNTWQVVRVKFDLNKTGYLPDDKLFVYFDPISDRVDRVMVTLFDVPFHGIPHWGEWSDYRRVDNGPIMPHVLDFRMTDSGGAADLGRHLSIVVEKMKFNVNLPLGVYGSLGARPAPLPEAAGTVKPKVLGQDVIDKED